MSVTLIKNIPEQKYKYCISDKSIYKHINIRVEKNLRRVCPRIYFNVHGKKE